MLKQFLLFLACISFISSGAQDYYIVTADNVNVRNKPVDGEVLGKVGKTTSFVGWFPNNGWVQINLPGLRGYVSEKFLRKTDLKNFSKTMLGDYMGECSSENISYSIGSLKQKDGYLVLYLTDYTAPDEDFGIRGHITNVFAGIPTKNGISLTHYLYPYDDDKPLAQQMTRASALDTPYEFVVTDDNKLRSFDRVLELQESAGLKATPVSERNLFHLAGNVKRLEYARAYSKDFIASMNQETGGNHPFENMVKIITFSPAGDIMSYTDINTADKSKINGKYEFSYNNNDVTVTGTRYSQPFSANYRRDIGEFGLSYEGNYRSEVDAGGINHSYALDFNGNPNNITYSRAYPPFVSYAADDLECIYHPSNNPLSPESADMCYQYGGDAWRFKNVQYKRIETDSHGNWIRRTAYIDGQPTYSEARKIEYY